MKLLISSVVFVLTVSVLFLFENFNRNTSRESAQLDNFIYQQTVTANPVISTISKNTSVKTTPETSTGADIINNAITNTPTVAPTLTPSPIKTAVPILTPRPTSSPTPAPTQIKTPTPAPLPTHSLTPLPSPSPTPTPTPTPTPQQTSQPFQEQMFFNLISFTNTVRQGDPAIIDAKTLPESSCLIEVKLPSGTVSEADGVKPKIPKMADFSGSINWSWKISSRTNPGIANIKITCSKNDEKIENLLQITIEAK